jgi:hypothetical protein
MQHPFNHVETQKIVEVKEKLSESLYTALSEMPLSCRVLLRENAILTGGATASVFHGETPNDFDLYLTDEKHIGEFKYMLRDSELLEFVEDLNPKYMVDTLVSGKLVTTNATTFKNKIQVITVANADARKTFDYVHCMPYMIVSDTTFHISKTQYDSIARKTLVVNPNASRVDQHRTEKFLNRGWKV